MSATYRFTRGAHSVGAEAQLRRRTPDSAQSTDSYKVGVFWRVDFARPARAPAIAAPSGVEPLAPTPDAFRLTAIPPGLHIVEIAATAARFDILGGVMQPGVIVYETRLLPDIDRRQRLAVAYADGRVTKTALIVDFDDVGSATSNSETFERVREALIRRHGAPARTFSLGAFSSRLADDVNNGTFIRTAEWRTPNGSIRLGIPRRLDRQVRIEVQLARGFASPRETLWNVESVR